MVGGKTMQGFIRKLKGELSGSEVSYQLPIADQLMSLNPLLGQKLKKLKLCFSGNIACVGCGRAIKKSYQQGYCFPCTQRLAECDLCIVRPERCHVNWQQLPTTLKLQRQAKPRANA